MTLINTSFPTLQDLALQQTIKSLTQDVNNQIFISQLYSQTLSQKIASDLFQHLSNAPLAGRFITLHSPNPLVLSNTAVLNSLKEQLPHITSIKISNVVLDAETIRVIREKFPNLQILKISDGSFAPNGLSTLLEGMQTISQFELSYATLDSAEAELLANYFHSNASLQQLVLKNLYFKEESQKEVLTEKLLLSLDGHRQLSSLQYENNGLGTRSIAAVGHAIESCPVLKKVKFTFDLFSDPGSKNLIPALAKKPDLVLDLSENYLSNESRIELLKTVKVILPK